MVSDFPPHVPDPPEHPRDIIRRLDRLERLMVKLCWALSREGSDQDGNWGHLPYGEILDKIRAEFPNISDPQ